MEGSQLQNLTSLDLRKNLTVGQRYKRALHNNNFFLRYVGWTEWGPWSSCDRLGCSVGRRSRERMCVDGVVGESECPGFAEETVFCEVELCPGKEFLSNSFTNTIHYKFYFYKYNKVLQIQYNTLRFHIRRSKICQKNCVFKMLDSIEN